MIATIATGVFKALTLAFFFVGIGALVGLAAGFAHRVYREVMGE